MAENENEQPQGAAAAQQPQDQQPAQDDQPVFQLQRCYLKDASLEMPHAPEILMEQQDAAPQVDIQFEVSQRLIQTDLYDVTVRGTITVKTPATRRSSSLKAASRASSRFTAFRPSRSSTSRTFSARRWSTPICAPTSLI